MEIFKCNVKDLFEANLMSHFPPFDDDFSCRNLTSKVVYFILLQFVDTIYADEVK